WMVEARGGLRFTPETNQYLARVRLRALHPFDCNNPMRIPLPRAVDYSHSPAADFTENPIVPQISFLVRERNFGQDTSYVVFPAFIGRTQSRLKQTPQTKATLNL